MDRRREEGCDGGRPERGGRGTRGLQGLVLLGAVLVLLLLGGAGTATAHSALRGTDPEDGTVLASAPRHITLTFTESVGLLDDSFRVYGPDSRRVRTGEPQRADGRSDTARITLPARLGQGTFTVAWRVVSADSHPVSGAFTFSVGKPSPAPAAVPTAPAEHPVTGSLYDIARYLAYIAAALLIGTAAFAALCRPPDPAPLRTPLLTGWWTLLAATVILLVLRAPYEAGTAPSTAFDASSLTRTLSSRPGMALLTRLVLLLLTAGLLPRLVRPAHPVRVGGVVRPAQPSWRGPRPVLLAAGAALAVGLALTWAAAEHASAGIQVPPAMTSSVLHLLAMAVWLGGLAALLTMLRRSTSVTALPASTVTRFSRLAFASVTVLVVTGVYQSWRGLGSWSALTGTSYGRMLAAKVVAVAVLLLAAASSRRWTARLATSAQTAPATARERVPELVASGQQRASGQLPERPERPKMPEMPSETGEPGEPEKREKPVEPVEPERPEEPEEPEEVGPPPPEDPDRHRRGLRRSVLAEVAVGAGVLMITTVLTGTPPARAQAEAAQAPPAAGLPPTSVTTIPFDVGTPGGRGKVQITLDPGRVGENGVQAVVYGPDGGLTSIPELRLSFTLPARKLGPIDAGLTDRGGYWATNDLTLPLAGTWTMKATVRVSDLDQVTESQQVRIAR